MAESTVADGAIVKGKSRAKWRNKALLMAAVAMLNLVLGLNIRDDLAGGWPWPAALPFANLAIAAGLGVYALICWRRSQVRT